MGSRFGLEIWKIKKKKKGRPYWEENCVDHAACTLVPIFTKLPLLPLFWCVCESYKLQHSSFPFHHFLQKPVNILMPVLYPCLAINNL